MKIAVIGPGSMGLLYGAKLSKCADVTLFGNNEKHITEIEANGMGMSFDANEQIDRLFNHLKKAPEGLTSIYSDLKNGRKTEVDYISGAVVNAALSNNIQAPSHELIVHMVHAMEGLYGNKN